jgi:hypothetical protein
MISPLLRGQKHKGGPALVLRIIPLSRSEPLSVPSVSVSTGVYARPHTNKLSSLHTPTLLTFPPMHALSPFSPFPIPITNPVSFPSMTLRCSWWLLQKKYSCSTLAYLTHAIICSMYPLSMHKVTPHIRISGRLRQDKMPYRLRRFRSARFSPCFPR